MPVLKHRDRIVVFRVTREEYEKLILACTRCSARNLTDFIRSEVLASLLEHDVPSGERRYLLAIDQKLSRVHADVQRLLKLLGERQC